MRELMRPRMDQVHAMILYQQGKTDKEIAQKLAVSSYTVRDWRLKNGLTANRPMIETTGHPNMLVHEAAEANRLGISYGQYKAAQFANQLEAMKREAAIFAARRKRKEARDAAKLEDQPMPEQRAGAAVPSL